MILKFPFLAAAVFATTGGLSVHAAVLAKWTFETSIPTTAGPHASENGTGSATGFHTTATTYTNPSGNGSAESFSSTNWSVGDYYQFATDATGYEGITVSFDQTGSTTGPRDFKLQYSIDGTAFTDFVGGGYAVTNAVTWTAGTPVPANSYSFDLSAVTVLNNDASIWFRLTDTSTTAIGGATVGTSGSGRVDNFTIATVPEPSSAFLGSLGIIALLRRRR